MSHRNDACEQNLLARAFIILLESIENQVRIADFACNREMLPKIKHLAR
ncbi:hypothetical protein Sj15T_13970 [Sphingobium sp. TA15]|nr:hypothetical protein Sj15T_13970 [Sphingobium sp. TA15]